MAEPLAVGVVGAGPWAELVHAPTFAAGPETHLAGVWARRPDAATALAARHGAPAFDRYEALLDACDAVAFAVPPDVQARLAAQAAAAGKALVLEKPVAADVDGAERLAAAVGEAGVASLVVLTWRYAAAVRSFLDGARALDPIGGTGRFVTGGFLGPPFATPWRLERGPLLDLGPHVVDLLDAALGEVVGVRAHGDRHGLVGLVLDHAGGATSTAALCATAPDQFRAGVEVYGRTPPGRATVDCATAVGPDAFATLRADLAAATAPDGQPHPLDVHHGLRLQRVLADAEAQLR